MQNLAKEYPEYSKIFKAIFDWFVQHPDQRAITMDHFYSDKYRFSFEDINTSFMIMEEYEILRTIYRVLDEDGSKIGSDFDSVYDIPNEVSTVWGQKKDKGDVIIVPFYLLERRYSESID
ncbi:hypothetical protein LZ575_02995 [Antarcticibacterium sp. 1MA-6-2]|uniref:hypothetical protein n=1 Tax=Antarcticibacterium sp. 1MA-6-2 TaxID=2908210 RepID=UPI001F24D627|nr:hypothetical protein [Antarcticibacterium sp. 1MA-6-2]UJH91669.1 hypothetical protein LZ575_02995 [Antarcticibacterium sp. 1MA-6-2]